MAFTAADVKTLREMTGVGMMDCKKVSEKRKLSVNFSESYYEASQMVLVLENDDTFDACKSAEDVENILKSK